MLQYRRTRSAIDVVTNTSLLGIELVLRTSLNVLGLFPQVFLDTSFDYA